LKKRIFHNGGRFTKKGEEEKKRGGAGKGEQNRWGEKVENQNGEKKSREFEVF